jgi:ribonuclease HI
MIIMTFWRIWHCRNEVIHHKPAPSIEASRRFLCSYLESLLTIKQFPTADAAKGKTVVSWCKDKKLKTKSLSSVKPPRPWRKPPEGHVKINVDGSFCATSGKGGAGAVLRDDGGSIIASACRFLSNCRSPLEAELEACHLGMALAMDWSPLPCVFETDCTEAMNLILAEGTDRSQFMGLVQETKRMMANRRNVQLLVVSREQNNVSHLLANFSRTSSSSEVWPGSGPVEITDICRDECNLGV